jgi:hypothetical protein
MCKIITDTVSKKLLLPVGVLLLVVSARVMFLLLPPPRTFLPSSIVILLLLPVKNDFARRSFPRDSEVTAAQLIRVVAEDSVQENR